MWCPGNRQSGCQHKAGRDQEEIEGLCQLTDWVIYQHPNIQTSHSLLHLIIVLTFILALSVIHWLSPDRLAYQRTRGLCDWNIPPCKLFPSFYKWRWVLVILEALGSVTWIGSSTVNISIFQTVGEACSIVADLEFWTLTINISVCVHMSDLFWKHNDGQMNEDHYICV